MDPVYVEVSTLPETLQYVLRSAGYRRADIAVYVAERASVLGMSGNGYRCFAALVHIASGQAEHFQGSWGGANMFSPTNPVDTNREPQELRPGFALINGREGGDRPVSCSLTVNPANAAPLLPAKPELTEREQEILGVVSSLNSGGRKNYWERHGNPPTEAELVSLVGRSLITRNRAGAVAITTAGRNAAGRKQYL